MPKFPTFPTLFDEVLQLEASQLKKWGYLEPNQIKSGIVTWSTNGSKTASISIMVNNNSEFPFIELDYKYGGEPRNYKIYLDTVPSNLGKGYVWYFICPEIKKRCRKLYSIGGYFLHREAFRGCMYEKQTHSKKWREMERIYGAYFDSDKLYLELYSKNFRKYYKGKPTRRYLKIMEKVERAESISYNEIENLMMFGI
tara:strand:- start:18372 stop:18965 length:594 start_codon:yes stop_codon:yes gene_type:complete